MCFPLDYHLHLCKPSLNELGKSKPALNQLLQQDSHYEVIWLDDEHSVDVSDQLLKEDVAVGQCHEGSRLDQVGAALDKQRFLLLQSGINS